MSHKKSEPAAIISPSVHTIIWDLDGTLMDSFGIFQECLNAALHEAGRTEASEHVLRHNLTTAR